MTNVRLRHPKGVTTISVDLDNATVLELQHIVFSATEITPSRQELKCGYPPRTLTLIPELPVSSLGIEKGDQLMVTELKAPGSSTTQVRTNPLPLSQPETPVVPDPYDGQSNNTPDTIPVSGGSLVHRVVPDDNSCLFSSIGIVFEQNVGSASKLRQVVADAIREDFVTWSDAVLGRPRDEYIQTILKPQSWGGAIELSVFSNHYGAEICSIDVETGRIDRFGSDKDYTSRCILLYSGIHYDAVSLAPVPDAPLDFHETLFNRGNSEVLSAAEKLATKLRAKKAYTNTASFDLRCGICKQGLKGEKEARVHAQDTGHTDFTEY